MKHTKSIVRLPALLLAAALLIGLAGGAYLRWGWPRDSFRLQTLDGDPSALQGFALAGRVYTSTTGLAFLMQDGQTERHPYWTYGQQWIEQDSHYFHENLLLALPDGDRARAEAGAEQQPMHSAGGSLLRSTARYGQRRTVEVSRVQRMLEVEISIDPKEGLRRLRLDLGTMELEEPVPLYAEHWEGEDAEDYGVHTVTDTMPRLQPLLLEGRYYFVMTDPVNPANNGLWRIDEALSEAQTAALPKTAQVDGEPVLPSSAAYGSVSLLWRGSEGQTVAGITAAEGKICLLVQDGGGETSLLVLEPDGSLCSSTALGAYPQSGSAYLAFGQSLRDDEVSVVYYPEPQKETPLWQAIQLRIKAGEVVGQAAVQSQGADGKVCGLMMNDEGTRLLAATEEVNSLAFHPRGNTTVRTEPLETPELRLAVYALRDGQTSGPLYTGRMATGAESTARAQLISPVEKAAWMVQDFTSRAWWRLADQAEREALWPAAAGGGAR